MIRATLILLALLAPGLAGAVTCADTEFEGNGYTVCEVDAAREDLRLFLEDDDGSVFGQFPAIARTLPEDLDLVFAMNAGMYHADRAPVGLYVEDGQEKMRLLTGASKGNFGLLPNGVFCIRDKRADAVETLRFERQRPSCRYATQSGPMLVIDGELHPRFLHDSTSRFIRNGVGTSADGQRVSFAISNDAVTFHQFGRFFRDVLKTPNALFLDGKVSRLYAPELDRSDTGFWLGPIVGVVAPR